MVHHESVNRPECVDRPLDHIARGARVAEVCVDVLEAIRIWPELADNGVHAGGIGTSRLLGVV
jgi:hypothetical protein